MTELLLPGAVPGHGGSSGVRPMMVVDDAHVTYHVYASGKKMSARDAFGGMNALRGGRGLHAVHALRGVSFQAGEGETIGVIGHNGSGKSTLFRAMSGLMPTSQGTIWAADRPVLLGVNAALMPDLSGENNIKLGLLAMGFTADEAAEKVEEIADFAELNEFLYHPMRTYSSGMGARLRFAIASAKAHSILLIDEALAVGDRRFKQKSEKRIRELRDSAGLVMIVSHSVGSLRDTCERVLWIHKGELRADGPAKDVIADYVKWTKQPGNSAVGAASTKPVAGSKARPKAASTAMPTTPPEVVAADAGAQPVTPGRAAATPAAALRAEQRDLARRRRHNRVAQSREKRRLVGAISTAVAIVLAVGAGATFAIVANLPDRTLSPLVLRTPTPRPTDQSSPPLVRTFGADAGTVRCETPDSVAEVRLMWEVEDASAISLTASAPDTGVGEVLATDLVAAEPGRAFPFSCTNETLEYTLNAENVAGARVSSVVTVARELAPQTGPETPQRQPQAPVQPAVPVEPQPGQNEQPQPGESPGAGGPGSGDPGTDDPGSEDPGTDEPGTGDPATDESVTEPEGTDSGA